MTGIIIVGAIGLICAILLVVASHFLSVPIDTRVEDIRGFLPGANCGACGYAGCDDYAKAVANGSAKPNLCIPGGASVSAQISEYLGVAAENTEPVKATVRCSGTCESAAKPRITTAPPPVRPALSCTAAKSLRLRLPGLWRLRQGLQIRCALHRGWRCPCG